MYSKQSLSGSLASTHIYKNELNVSWDEYPTVTKQQQHLVDCKEKGTFGFFYAPSLSADMHSIMSLPSWNPSSSSWTWLYSWLKYIACSRWTDQLSFHHDSALSIYQLGFPRILHPESIPNSFATFAPVVEPSIFACVISFLCSSWLPKSSQRRTCYLALRLCIFWVLLL